MAGPEEPNQEGTGPACSERGWFDAAFISKASVFDCLQKVIALEATRVAFVQALQEKLAPDKEAPTDRVTDLIGRLTIFGNTLKFRLGLLSPERTGAWFRDSMRCTGGPFPQQILADPIFNAFRPSDTQAIAAGLRASFAARTVEPIPFLKQESCLWLTLLELNREWDTLCRLALGQEVLRLDILPDGLPTPLESQTLRTFLQNVRSTLLTARNRLDESYYSLWHASSLFFKHMQPPTPPHQKPPPKSDAATGDGNEREASQTTGPRRESPRGQRQSGSEADDLRESMRHRRAHMVRQRVLTLKERRALEFMEFDTYPDALSLKKRYHLLARKYHPDTPGGNEEEFKKLGSFYNYLVECLRHDPAGNR